MVASNVGLGGDAVNATISTSDITGLQDVNIFGGQSGINLVKGTAVGNFDATASSVVGNATASSDVNARGIFDANNDGIITTSGNLTAIAQLANTVTAITVNGAANATATSDAVGLSGYNVTIIGSGTLTASATSLSESTAGSVIGNAHA